MRVVVTGATGQTGRRVVERLLQQGHLVRALVRNADSARKVLGDSAALELFHGDVRERSTLTALGRDASVAVLATGTRSYFGANGGAAVDALGTRNLVDALNADGVKRVVQVSAFGLDRKSPWLQLFSLGLNRYFHWKALAESAVRESGLEYAILRPVELRNRPARGLPHFNQSAPLSLLRTMSRDMLADVIAGCVQFGAGRRTTFELCEAPTTGRVDAPTPSLSDRFTALREDGAREFPTRTPLL
ncbi:MAG: NAD(P)H-binding protein [Polyangiaceae bacterium]